MDSKHLRPSVAVLLASGLFMAFLAAFLVLGALYGLGELAWAGGCWVLRQLLWRSGLGRP